MSFNLNNRHLLSLVHHTEQEIRFLLDLSRDLKRAKYAGTEQQTLKGKNIALIFEKTSTRTRCAFEVAAYDQGAQVTYIDPTSSQIGHKESMKDTARVLGRMYDAIEYRGFKQSIVEELAEYAGVPVFNGLTDEWHPTQMLADVLTMQEHSDKPLRQISYAYLGDARNTARRRVRRRLTACTHEGPQGGSHAPPSARATPGGHGRSGYGYRGCARCGLYTAEPLRRMLRIVLERPLAA